MLIVSAGNYLSQAVDCAAMNERFIMPRKVMHCKTHVNDTIKVLYLPCQQWWRGYDGGQVSYVPSGTCDSAMCIHKF